MPIFCWWTATRWRTSLCLAGTANGLMPSRARGIKSIKLIMKDGKIYKNTLGQIPERKKAGTDRPIKSAALSADLLNLTTTPGPSFHFCAIHQSYHSMGGNVPFAGLRPQMSSD